MNHDFSDEIDLNLIDESDEESYINNNERATINYNQLAQLKKPINFLPNSHLAQTNFVFNQNMTLKSVNLIPVQFRNVFASFPYFNHVQSTVFDDAVYSDKNIVISAPTSSGKTVLLELAIIRLLTSLNYSKPNASRFKFKIIYMAPLKALCTEKYNEWYEKFEKLHGLKCIELTGDTDVANENEIENANIICTTPEKWDSMTRKWKNRHSIMSRVRLMLIDEIHVLGESSRGAIIEAVISRMKLFSLTDNLPTIRFIAISATIPNIDDIAFWLSGDFSTPATVYKLNESYRPVNLNKVVIGYKCDSGQKDFLFDMKLNYKISDVIDQYSNGKPTLIFCSTRKVTVQAAKTLAESKSYFMNQQHRQTLKQSSQNIKDPFLKNLISSNGIGYHHAGLESSDRSLIENLFLNSNLLVLYSTSTLSIGVNLPAHLVIIKSTMYYSNQNMIEYSTSQILQMIGRAGRPQFDTSATAVIMTKSKDKKKYESLVEGQQLIESQLHLSLIEHLNVEIVLRTVLNLSSAVNWLKSTFFYARLKKNPQYYGVGLDKNTLMLNNESRIEMCLKELCIKSLNDLMYVNLIEKCDFILNPNAELKPTMSGQLMARYCTAFNTMRLIIENVNESNSEIDNTKTFLSLETLINLIAQSKELEDVKLRTNEKSLLNSINNNGKQPKANADLSNLIRYIQEGKVKTNQTKINILIQAQFGSLQLNDFSLTQDIFKIFRIGQRISRCLFEYQLQMNNQIGSSNQCKNYLTFLNSVILYKNFVTKLWFDSPHVFKQFNRIGSTLSLALVNAGITSFEDILKMNPRSLERTLNKNPPFGNRILETIEKLPRFKIEFNQEMNTYNETLIDVICRMENYDYISTLDDGGCLGLSNQIMFVVGDENYNLLYATRWSNNLFLKNNGSLSKRFSLEQNKNGSVVHASLVLLQFVGLDVHDSIETFDSNKIPQLVKKSIDKPKKKVIHFQNEINEQEQNDYYSDDVFDSETPHSSSPLKSKKRKLDLYNNLESSPETVKKQIKTNHFSDKENLPSRKFDFNTKKLSGLNQIETNVVTLEPKKDFQKLVAYSPKKEESMDYLSKLFENEMDEDTQTNESSKENFEVKKTKSRIEITKIKKSNVIQSNKIINYFKPIKEENFQNSIAYDSPIKLKSLDNNSDVSAKTRLFKKRFFDDELDDLPGKQKKIFQNAYNLYDFNL